MRNFYYDFFKNKYMPINSKKNISKNLIEDLKNFNFKQTNNLQKIKETKNNILLHKGSFNRIYWLEKTLFENLMSFSGKIETELDYKLLQAGLIEEKTPSHNTLCSNNKPNSLSVFPTNNCNLDCVYCYANAGTNNTNIDMDFVKTGIDWFLSENQKTLMITFHGGGEPTTAMDIIKNTANYARSKVDKLLLSASTNGVFNNETCEYLIENFSSLTISCDGTQEIQNKQRPTKNNEKSSHLIEETINRFNESNLNYSIRSTITDYSCEKQNEMVEYFSNLNCKNLHFEPMFESLKSQKTTAPWTTAPNPTTFIENFLKAKELSDEYGLNLHCSYLPIGNLKNKFCKAAGDNFCLTTDGAISSCYEATNIKNKQTKDLMYGHFNKKDKIIEINNKKLEKLNNRSLENLTDCNACKFKHGCGGFCLSKTLVRTGDLTKIDPKICDIIHGIGEGYLNLFFEKKIKKFTPHLLEEPINGDKYYCLFNQKLKILDITTNEKITNKINNVISTKFEFLISKENHNIQKIIKLKPKILFVFITNNKLVNKTNYEIFNKSKKILEDKKIIVKITNSLPYCITGEKSFFPCENCLELFKLENKGQKIIFCKYLNIPNNNINKFETYDDILTLVKNKNFNIKTNECINCLYLIRGLCKGKCKKITN